MKALSGFMLALIMVMGACKTSKYPNLSDGLYADINTDKGDILIQLEYKDVPVTTASLVSLAEGTNPYVDEKYKGKHFFDGLTFHRVVPGFVVQGGDPEGTGRGGPGYQFEDEIPLKENGEVKFSHDGKGVLAMANSGPNTNGSQFYITLDTVSRLDGGYTVFGHVVKGQEVVDSIAQGDVMNKIDIIRVGKDASDFDAPKIFANYFKKLEEEAKKKAEQLQAARESFKTMAESYKEKAETLPSGLKIYYINKGDGEKPAIGSQVPVYYAGYFTTGDLFDSNMKDVAEKYGKYDSQRDDMGGYQPFPMDYSQDAQLIPGFKEGLLNMSVGDKVMIFIPSYLGYGPQGKGPIPPDTDLIFELEIPKGTE